MAPRRIEWRFARALAAAALIALSGCAELGYYWQAVEGQLSINAAREPVTRVMADPQTPPALKARLAQATAIRDFASRELALPDNDSYRSYADLKRPYVVWNVFAAEEFSVTPRQWCFPFAGCVAYRGYFAQAGAEAYAAELRAQGLEVYVAGVPAYSTLGWFDDPLLNTFINYPDAELARLIFHELAHQVVYVKGDSEFNESFAVAVERAGLARWLAAQGEAAPVAAVAQARERRVQFLAVVTAARDRLAALYRLRLAPDAMRARKGEVYAQLARDYAALKQQWKGYTGYDRFFEGINNATLASVVLYNARVPAFERLLAEKGGDLAAFYAAVQSIAALEPAQRAERLDAGAH